MSYIQKSLGSNETLHYVAHFHWVYYALAYGALVISIALGAISFNPDYAVLAFAPVAVGLVIFLAIMVPIWTTEIGVTSQRLIYKRGLIQRETAEMQLRSVEQISVDQGVLGRILGYGRLTISGTGEEEIGLPAIADPIEMRRALQEALGVIQGGVEEDAEIAQPA